jgi:hypothetical protein
MEVLKFHIRHVLVWEVLDAGWQISDISKKSMQANIYCHYDWGAFRNHTQVHLRRHAPFVNCR